MVQASRKRLTCFIFAGIGWVLFFLQLSFSLYHQFLQRFDLSPFVWKASGQNVVVDTKKSLPIQAEYEIGIPEVVSREQWGASWLSDSVFRAYTESPFELEIVVAHFRAQRNFSKLLAAFYNVTVKSNRSRWVIYNKHIFASSELANVLPGEKQWINLENVGREGHTFLYHMAKNYDNLAKHTIFCQEEPHSWRINVGLERHYRQNTGFIGLGTNKICNCSSLLCPPFKVYGLQTMWLMLRQKPCSADWYATLTGCFLVSRERIRQNPRSLYNNLLILMETEDPNALYLDAPPAFDEGLKKIHRSWSRVNPYFGHIVERSWNIIMGCENSYVCMD
jgi:hypothetical protein